MAVSVALGPVTTVALVAVRPVEEVSVALGPVTTVASAAVGQVEARAVVLGIGVGTRDHRGRGARAQRQGRAG